MKEKLESEIGGNSGKTGEGKLHPISIPDLGGDRSHCNYKICIYVLTFVGANN